MSKKPDKASALELLRAATAPVELPSSASVVPPSPPQDQDLWQIVVVGTIDPRQHHPSWYRLIDCISESELDTAKQTATIVIMPPQTGPRFDVVQFDVGPFAVIAMQDRWTIQTVTKGNRERIVRVASAVFTKLNEIYVSAFGINRKFALPLRSATARQFIATRLTATDLALPSGDAEGELNYKVHGEGTDTTIRILPSPSSERWLEVFFNRHHPILLGKVLGYFDVGKAITDNAERDWAQASQYSESLENSIKRTERSTQNV